MITFEKKDKTWTSEPITAAEALRLSNKNLTMELVMPKIYAKIRMSAIVGVRSVEYDLIDKIEQDGYRMIIEKLKDLGYVAYLRYDIGISRTYLLISW